MVNALEVQRADRLRQIYLDMAEHLDYTSSWISLITDQRVLWSDYSGDWKTYEFR